MAELVRKLGKSEVQTYRLGEGEQHIGRATDNHIQIQDSAVSSHHADIVGKPSPYQTGRREYFILDRGSRNGVFINGDRQTHRRLKHGDRIRIGNQKFEFVDDPREAGDQTIIRKPSE